MKPSGKVSIQDRLWARKFLNWAGRKFNTGDELPLKDLKMPLNVRDRLIRVGKIVPADMLHLLPANKRPKTKTILVTEEVVVVVPQEDTPLAEPKESAEKVAIDKEMKPKRGRKPRAKKGNI